MHDIEDLVKLLKLSEYKVREMLENYSETLGKELQTGKRGKKLVTQAGLNILLRAKELEEPGRSPKDVKKILMEEISNNESKVLTDSTRFGEELIKELRERNQDLKEELAKRDEQIKFLQQRIEALEDLLRRQLPPAPDEVQQKGEGKISRWDRFKQLLRGK